MTAWLLVLGGVLLGALGTAAGVGAAALSRIELTRWVSHRLRGAAVAGALLGAPERILGAANVLTTFGVVLAALGLAGLLAPLPPLGLSAVVVLGAIPLLVTVTYAVPRALARRWPQAFLRATGPWLDRFGRAVAPLLPSRYATPHAEVSSLLRAESGAELFGRDELALVSGLLAFTERPVHDVMTARTDIVAVAEGASVAEVARLVAESGYSRLPAYRESLDNIIGMVYAFDLLKVAPGGELRLRPVTVAPGSKSCADLLFEMQRERRQFAVVLDEFGGTAGIATFDDLLEELVETVFGEPQQPRGGDAAATTMEADGGTGAEEVAARFGVSLPGQAKTVGGLLAQLTGRIPLSGERFILGDLELDVLQASPTRVERVVIRRLPIVTTSLDPDSAP